MKRKAHPRTQSILSGIFTLFLLTIVLSGCTKSNSPYEAAQESPPLSDYPQDTQNPSLETANLGASVIQLLENGAVVRPTLNSTTDDGGQVAEQSLEDTTTDITMSYAETTLFQIAEIDRSTYEIRFSESSQEDVKKESSIYAWGVYSGTDFMADRIVIARYV